MSEATPAPAQAPETPATSDEPALLAEGVRKRFGPADEEVLRGVTLRIDRGELVGLMGRSGSGKSTLLHILGGLDRAFTGRVRVCGQELAALDDRALARLRNDRIGFVFQSFHLLDHLSCAENVLLPNAFAAAPLPHREALTRAEESLERVGLLTRAKSRPAELSGGQKQRVAIARALFFRPEVLLCDEPTGNLDEHTGQQIIDLFRGLHDSGLTLLLVTHELRVAEAARRIVRIEAGEIVEERRTPESTGTRSGPAAPPEQTP